MQTFYQTEYLRYVQTSGEANIK